MLVSTVVEVSGSLGFCLLFGLIMWELPPVPISIFRVVICSITFLLQVLIFWWEVAELCSWEYGCGSRSEYEL